MLIDFLKMAAPTNKKLLEMFDAAGIIGWNPNKMSKGDGKVLADEEWSKLLEYMTNAIESDPVIHTLHNLKLIAEKGHEVGELLYKYSEVPSETVIGGVEQPAAEGGFDIDIDLNLNLDPNDPLEPESEPELSKTQATDDFLGDIFGDNDKSNTAGVSVSNDSFDNEISSKVTDEFDLDNFEF